MYDKSSLIYELRPSSWHSVENPLLKTMQTENKKKSFKYSKNAKKIAFQNPNKVGKEIN